MDSSAWTNVIDLFRKVVEVEPEDRDAWLAHHCRDDEQRSAVLRMLEEDARSTGPLDGAVRLPEPMAAAPLALGTVIGGYTVTGVIATGGMGTVFEAQQSSPRRRVALKTLRAELMTDQGLRRFRVEAEILGSLRHPGIAKIHEFGVVEAAGREQPYLAMEYVPEAASILSWAQGRSRTDVLHVFLDACEAVQHAHLRGIVHRDVKPSNLLVDGSGQVKVIDFGIARVLDQDLLNISVDRTETGRIPGTLLYMSPEQRSGRTEDVDLRTDVYALGVVLFQLLSGQHPYPLEALGDVGFATLARELEEGEPRRLRDLRAELSGDLDWITAKALAREPARRYASVHELALDLRRHLAFEPVLARPPSRWYRVARRLRRHRVGLAVALSLAFVASVGALSTLWQSGVASARTQERNDQRRMADAANDFVMGALRSAGPSVEREAITLRRFLDLALEELERSPPDHPSIDASISANLAGTYRELGVHAEAKRMYERALAMSSLVEGFEEEERDRLRLAALTNQFDLGPAEETERAAAALSSAFAAQRGPADPWTLDARRLRGMSLAQSMRLEEAEAVLEDVIATLEETSIDDRRLAQGAYAGLAQVLADGKRPLEAIAVYERYLERFPQVLLDGSTEGRPSYEHLVRELNLGELYLLNGEVERGLELFARALPTLASSYGLSNPPIVAAHAQYARALLLAGRLEECLPVLEDVLQTCREVRGKSYEQYGFAMLTAAQCLLQLEVDSDAEEMARAALEVEQQLDPGGTLRACRANVVLGIVLARSGRGAEARDVAREAERIATERLAVDHPLQDEVQRLLRLVEES